MVASERERERTSTFGKRDDDRTVVYLHDSSCAFVFACVYCPSTEGPCVLLLSCGPWVAYLRV